MSTVELIYDADCPNVRATRETLLRAFAALSIVPQWQEWERSAESSPVHVRDYASPTILVNGRDIAQGSPVAGQGACRVYSTPDGRLLGVPRLTDITLALSATATVTPANAGAASTLKTSLPALPGIGFALLPKLTCAACWPAYAGLLSTLGIGFFDYTPYLFPLAALFLILNLVAIAYRASARRGFAPLVLGALAAMIILIGKFQFDSGASLYVGVALLAGASLWNAWPKVTRGSCPSCVPHDLR